jgi:hypothetical protein
MAQYEKNENFIDREYLLVELFSEFRNPTPKKPHSRIALHALGGIGKTLVANEYIRRYKHFYKRIYWISADAQTYSILPAKTRKSMNNQIGRVLRNHGITISTVTVSRMPCI